MPVYNGEKYLGPAIRSILNQTFADFELLVLLDPSTDRSEDIARSFGDHRIIVVKNDSRLGLVGSLNYGINLAQGKFVARMDSDDDSLPNRFDIQVRFLEKNPGVGIVGAWALATSHLKQWKLFKMKLKLAKIFRFATPMYNLAMQEPPTDPDLIKCLCFFVNPFIHPSIMMRKEVLDNFHFGYDPQFLHIEDYELWTRMLDVTTGVNLGRTLLIYRVHPMQVGMVHKATQLQNVLPIQATMLQKLGITPSNEELRLHNDILLKNSGITPQFIGDAEVWLVKLSHANKLTKYVPERKFSQFLAQMWMTLCGKSSCPRWWIWKKFWNSPLNPAANLGISQQVTLIVRWVVGFTNRQFF
jgi:glycosyltransferase involved in cell wall biosynthesis